MSNFLKDHLPAGLASQIFEDEPPSKQSHPTPIPVATQPQVVMTNVGVSAPIPITVTLEAVDHTDDAYQRLLAISDFTQTPIFQSLNKYLAPLASSGLDDKMKFGIALKQAQSIDGLDPQSVLGIFDKFKTDLTSAANNFAQAVVNKAHVEVDVKNAKAADLQAQAKQLTEEAFAAQQKLQQNQHRFDVALQTRTTELAQEQAKYASFLA